MTSPDSRPAVKPKRPSGAAVSGSSSRSAIQVTTALIGLNVVIFVVMSLAGAHLFQRTGEQILRWGGNYGPLTLTGQWWRLITAMFVHVGFLHLAVNMWCLYELGTLAEEIYGGYSVLGIYLLTGVAGGIVSLANNPDVLSAGASGAIFGLAGALITTLLLGKLALPERELKILLLSLLAFAGYNLTFGFMKGGVDNGAHVGGLVSGILIGVFLSRTVNREAAVRGQRVTVFSLSLIALVAGFWGVQRKSAPLIAINSARQAVERGNADVAIRTLAMPLRSRPNDPTVYLLLGTAYAQKKQFKEAEFYFEKTLQLSPNNPSARDALGLVYVATGRLPDAIKEFQEEAELNPASNAAWLQLGLLQQRMGNHHEAVTALKKAVALNPNWATAQFALGTSEMNLRQYKDAITAFRAATELQPNDYSSQLWLANAYEAAGMTKEADAAYFNASRLQAAARRQRQLTPRVK